MKTADEIKKLNGFEYTSEVSKIILFNNDSEIKPFLKWTKLELLAFYNEWTIFSIGNMGDNDVELVSIKEIIESVKEIMISSDDELRLKISRSSTELINLFNVKIRPREPKVLRSIYVKTMKDNKHELRSKVDFILTNMFRKISSDPRIYCFDGGGARIYREEFLDYITTKQREILIDELIN